MSREFLESIIAFLAFLLALPPRRSAAGLASPRSWRWRPGCMTRLDIALRPPARPCNEVRGVPSQLNGVPDLEQILWQRRLAELPGRAVARLRDVTVYRGAIARRARSGAALAGGQGRTRRAQLFTTDTLTLLRRTDDGALAPCNA